MKKIIPVILAIMVLSSTAMATHPSAGLQSLIDGNARFATGTSVGPRRDGNRRQELTTGQHPSAIVVSCSDSRVPPELLFDQGLGDLFVIRTAGEVEDELELGSIEYAVEHLRAPLIVVLGHSQCGAVSATIKGGDFPPHIEAIVQQISPAVEKARHKRGDLLENAIEENVRRVMSLLMTSSPIVAEAVHKHHVQIVGAVYDINTGAVHFLK